MKCTVFLLAGLLFLSITNWGQTEKVLLTIDDNEITKAEFERIYKKNNQDLYDESEVKSPKEYLDLFINYKLKVIEAQRLEMDTSAAFQSELAGYRKDLAAPYLTDMNYDEKLVRELYDRMTKEVSASHILLRLPENASPEEEQEALQKLSEIKEEIQAGKAFSEAAREYSQDPGGAQNGGQLGYFTAFQMVAPFENAAFNTPEGEISEPVRSSFGYHLIKVHDVRENKGEIKVRHIMKMFPQGVENFDKSELKNEIDSIYEALQNGADFAEMAKEHSDDKRSAVQGGEMPWFPAGRMIPAFSEPAYALENNGDMTEPIETPFGFHIIKKIDHRPVPSFEEAKADIEKRIKSDPARNNSSQKAFVEKLKKEYNFSGNSENIRKIRTIKSGETIAENLLLFTIDNKEFRVKDFSDYLEKKNLSKGNYTGCYDDWVTYEIIALENAKLEKKHPEFRYLMKEYHDGILLFNIMEEKIWEYASEDSTGLQKFYKKNKGKYHWEERFKGVVVKCKNQECRENAEKYFASGMTPEEVTDQVNKEEKLIEIKEGAWEKESNEVVDYFVWNGPETGNFDTEFTFVRGEKIPPEPKTLDEARGLYISDYQKYLEEKWIKKLRKRYKIKVNKKVLKTIPNV